MTPECSDRWGRAVPRLNRGWQISGIDTTLTVLELIRARVEAAPDALAVSDGLASWTYQDVASLAVRCAETALRRGMQPGDRIGIALPSGAHLVAAALGAWSAGLVVVPVDLTQPATRNRLILTDAGAQVVCSLEPVPQSLLPSGAAEMLPWDVSDRDARDALDALDDDGLSNLDSATCVLAAAHPGVQPAMILYTSGTTGAPKGVVLGHAGLSNILQSTLAVPGIRADDRMLAVASPGFDMCWSELLMPLVAGASSHVLGRDMLADADAAGEFLRRHAITIAMGTPSLWESLLDAGAVLHPGMSLWLGGEPLPRRLVDRAAAAGASVWNLYGPTETTMYVTVGRAFPGPDTPTIGWAVANTQVLLAEEDTLGSGGEPNELLVQGPGVALGYHGLPELTEERFPGRTGSPTFRTGDRAARQEDDALVFLGRGDRQVKVRGNRVELGEVEAALIGHPSISACQVTATSGIPRRLEAKLVVADPDIDADEIRSWLSGRLPASMLPHRFSLYGSATLTPNGKSQFDLGESVLPGGSAPSPRHASWTDRDLSSGEIAVARVWSAALGHDDFGLDETFTAAGGDSLGQMLLVNEGRRAGMAYTVGLLQKAPTVREQVAALGEADRLVPPTRAAEGPLLPVQRRFLEWELEEPSHYVLPVLLTLGDANAPVVREALAALVQRHPALRSRIIGEPLWTLTSLAFAEGSDEQPADDVTLESTAQLPDLFHQVHRSMGPGRGDLFRAIFVTVGSADSPSHLLLVIHHLACDGYAMQTLLQDLQSLYRGVCSTHGVLPSSGARPHGAIAMPASSADPMQHGRSLVEWSQSEGFANSLRQILGRPWARALSLPHVGADPHRLDEVKTATRSVSVTRTLNLLRGGQGDIAGGTGAETLLLTSVLYAMKSITNTDTHVVDVCRHGRISPDPRIELSRTVGWLATVSPYVITLTHRDPVIGLPDVAAQIVEQHEGDVAYGVARWMSRDPQVRAAVSRLQVPQVYVNYRSHDVSRPPVSAPFEWADVDLGNVQTRRGFQQYPFKLWADVKDSQLILTWAYAPRRQPDWVVDSLVDGTLTVLNQLLDEGPT